MVTYQPVMVHEDRLEEVYALLAFPNGDGSEDSTPSGPNPVGGSPDWSDAEIQKAYRESGENMKQVLDLLAARPEVAVRSDELYLPMGLNSRQFSGVLGSFGKRVAGRYGKSQWFFSAEWDHESGAVAYTMTQRTVDLIRNA